MPCLYSETGQPIASNYRLGKWRQWLVTYSKRPRRRRT